MFINPFSAYRSPRKKVKYSQVPCLARQGAAQSALSSAFVVKNGLTKKPDLVLVSSVGCPWTSTSKVLLLNEATKITFDFYRLLTQPLRKVMTVSPWITPYTDPE